MTIAIHQPNYLPWPGYFSKICAADVFVFHDSVAFSDRAVTKRTWIRDAKASSEKRWLTVPVKKHSHGQPISDIEIQTENDWASTHLRAIQNTYLSAAHFAEVYPVLSDFLRQFQAEGSLGRLNIGLVMLLSELLGFEAEFKRSSVLVQEVPELARIQDAHEMNIEIVNALNGDAYVSGSGAKEYQQDDDYNKRNIKLIYSDMITWMQEHPYDQGTTEFVPGLSIIDALMHMGVAGTREYIDRFVSGV